MRSRSTGRRLATAIALVAALGVLVTPAALAVDGTDSEVTVASNDGVFSQNKQNEPGVAIDAIAPNIVAAGSNDNIDMEACNAGNPTTCPFTDGVGVSGIYFSTDGGDTWVQPQYTGWTARQCVGPPGFTCTPGIGPIGTLPRYYESRLVSDGDPSLAFGPRRGPDGRFSWANGSRLYYANLTSNFSAERSEQGVKGFEAVAVSRLDVTGPGNRLADALAGVNNAWYAPVIASRQNAALFSDKETLWVDNAASSRFFGYAYVCNVAFRSAGRGGAPEPVMLARSTDGGATWQQRQISQAANTNRASGRAGGRQGCTVRTDSTGIVYVFWNGSLKNQDVQLMTRSVDGGSTFERPRPVAAVEECGLDDPASGRHSFDGVAGARTNSFPSVDIANGAPTGAGAPDTIVMTWCDGPTPAAGSTTANEQALVTYSSNRGATWSTPVNGAEAGDRPDFPAVAISPDGSDVYLTYDAFLQPWQPTTATPRLMQGVVRHAPAGLALWSTLHRGAAGDARASSQNNLAAEFLGDYNYAAATNDAVVAVWNDVREAADCPAIDAYRQALVNYLTGVSSTPPAAPRPNVDCPPTFGNTDIWGGSFADPT